MTPAFRVKSTVVKTLVFVAATLLTLALAEAAVRALFWSTQNLALFIDRQLLALIEAKGISDKTMNIYYFGDSTMEGVYGSQLSIPTLVDYLLDHRLNEQEIRSVNAARSGADLRYNLNRIRRLVARKADFHPSVVVIYAGHNEFLKFHPQFGLSGPSRWHAIINWLVARSLVLETAARGLDLHRLELDERAAFDQALFARGSYEAVIRKYNAEIGEAVSLLRKHKIPFIVSTVAGNYSDWEPNRSIFCANEGDRPQFEELMAAGRRAEEASRLKDAVSSYQAALRVCESFAETHYRLGATYRALNEPEAAWAEYVKAVEYDGMPMRAVATQNDWIRSLEEDGHTFTVDAVEHLRKQASDGLIGFNLMVDGHHPNQRAYILIAQLIANKIHTVVALDPGPVQPIDDDVVMETFELGADVLCNIYISRGRWAVRLATWRYDPTERLRLASEFFLRAMELEPSRYEPYLGLATVGFLQKRVAEAEVYLSKARMMEAEGVDEYLDGYWVRSIIRRAYVKR